MRWFHEQESDGRAEEQQNHASTTQTQEQPSRLIKLDSAVMQLLASCFMRSAIVCHKEPLREANLNP